jgi:hypothetical protein
LNVDLLRSAAPCNILVRATKRCDFEVRKALEAKGSLPRQSLESAGRQGKAERSRRERGPQRVTVHGRDAVVVVRAEEFDRMRRPLSGRDLLVMMASSPLADVDFERLSVKSPVRDVDHASWSTSV